MLPLVKIPALYLQPVDQQIRDENVARRRGYFRPLARIRRPVPMREFIAASVRKRKRIPPLTELTEILR